MLTDADEIIKETVAQFLQCSRLLCTETTRFPFISTIHMRKSLLLSFHTWAYIMCLKKKGRFCLKIHKRHHCTFSFLHLNSFTSSLHIVLLCSLTPQFSIMWLCNELHLYGQNSRPVSFGSKSEAAVQIIRYALQHACQEVSIEWTCRFTTLHMWECSNYIKNYLGIL